MAMSVFVYAGSLQYASIPMLAAMVHPLYAFLMAIMINARHIFYGISMLDKYNGTGAKKPYLVFGLTDETFSVVCDERVPDHIDRKKLYFWITLFDQSYWVLGTLIGCVAGSLITFNTREDFVLRCSSYFYESVDSTKNHLQRLPELQLFVCLQIFVRRHTILVRNSHVLS